MRGRTLTVIATVGGSEGTAAGVVSRSNVGRDDIEAWSCAAEQAARDAGPAEDAQPLVTGSAAAGRATGPSRRPRRRSASSRRSHRRSARSSDAPAPRAASCSASPSTDVTTTYLGTSTGLRLRHDQPTGRIEVTGKTDDSHPVDLGRAVAPATSPTST